MKKRMTCFLLAAAIYLLPLCTMAQTPCLPAAGFANGGFESFTVSAGNCSFNGDGIMGAPFNAGCISSWFAPNGTPNLISGIAGGNTPVSPPPGSTVFAGLVVWQTPKGCENEAIAITLTLDPNAVYELTFKHRKAIAASSLGQPGNVTGQVFVCSGLTNHPASVAGPEACFTPPNSQLVFSGSAGTSGWVTETVTFTATTGQNQICFAPTNPSVSTSTWWLIDDITLRKCQPCKAKFTNVSCATDASCVYSFLNQSVAGSGATLTGSTWTVTALNDPEQPVFTSTDQNLVFVPSCDGRYRVCLTIKDSKGCTREYCEEINVTCTACRCQAGPNPCEAIPNPTDSVKKTETITPAALPATDYFKVYPNPAQSSFRLQFTAPASQLPAVLQVYSTGGDLVATQRLAFVPGQVNSLTVADLQPGLYLLRVMQGKEIIYTEKVVITR